jgi:hypothetical protein
VSTGAPLFFFMVSILSAKDSHHQHRPEDGMTDSIQISPAFLLPKREFYSEFRQF